MHFSSMSLLHIALILVFLGQRFQLSAPLLIVEIFAPGRQESLYQSQYHDSWSQPSGLFTEFGITQAQFSKS